MTVLLVVILIAPSGEPVSCGASCLFLLTREAERPLSLDEAQALLPDAPNGCSFDDLRKAVAAGGVRTALANVRTSGGRLPHGPFVAHFRSKRDDPVGHFVFFRPLEPTFRQYQMIAPPLEPEVVEADELLSRPDFSGWVMTRSDHSHALIFGIGLIAGAVLLYRFGSSKFLRAR